LIAEDHTERCNVNNAACALRASDQTAPERAGFSALSKQGRRVQGFAIEEKPASRFMIRSRTRVVKRQAARPR
jgi:hypothetical protein